MKITKKILDKLIFEELTLVLEGEDADIFGGEDEEAGGDEGGDEEAADDTEEEGGEDEGGDEEATDDEGGEEGEGEDESAIPEPDLTELPPGERAELTKAVDDELNALFMDFEANALHSAAVGEENLEILAQETSYTSRLKRYLFEAEEEGEAPVPNIDMHRFANDAARLVSHYQDLLDMEQLIFNKAKYFLMAKYDEAAVEEFEEIMSIEHGIDFEDKGFNEPFDDAGKPETPWPPRAVGAAPPMA